MSKRRKTWEGRVYLRTDEHGRELYDWVGRFATKRERDHAVAKRRVELEQVAAAEQLRRDNPAAAITCAEYADEYLARMEDGRLRTKSDRTYKASTIDTARGQLKRFTAEFGDRTLDSITRHEAVQWAEKHDRKQGVLQAVVTMFGLAVDEELLDRNPFRGLMRKPDGRAEQPPPSPEQMVFLLDACSALGDHADRMRAMLTFAAYMIARPSELFALTWDDVDLEAGVVHVNRGLYRGRVDLPKSNKPRTIALTPPARRALLSLPERHGYVFRSITGKRMSAGTLTNYWQRVLARAGLDFDFYLATKHFGVHYMKVELDLPNADIAAQAGWSESAIEGMVRTYAHTDVGALDRIKARFEAVGSDALPTQEGADAAL